MRKQLQRARHVQGNRLWPGSESRIGGQVRRTLLITCLDLPNVPESLTPFGGRDLFVVRNLGNLVPPPDTAGSEAAAIEYAISRLSATDIIICGHYGCPAMLAALELDKVHHCSSVSCWLAHAWKTLDIMERDFSHLEGQARWDKAVEQNVLVQIRCLAAHPIVAAGLASRSVALHAWTVGGASGEIFSYDVAQHSFVAAPPGRLPAGATLDGHCQLAGAPPPFSDCDNDPIADPGQSYDSSATTNKSLAA